MPGLKVKQTTNLALIIPYQASYQEQECNYAVHSKNGDTVNTLEKL